MIDTVLLPSAAPAKGAHLAPMNSRQVAYVCPQTGRVMTYRTALTHAR